MKRKLTCVLTLIMIFSTLAVTILSTVSFSSQQVSISLIPNPKIDIVLAKARTNTNTTSFESDLLNSLESKSINTDNVKVSAVETVASEVNESDAAQIYDTWSSYTVEFSRAALTPSLTSYTSTNASSEWTIAGDKIQRNTANSTLSMFVSPEFNDDTNAEFTTQFGLNVANSSIHGEAWYFFKIDESLKNGYGLVWDNHTACGPFSNADYQLYLIKMTNGSISVLQKMTVASWAVGRYWDVDIKIVNNKATIKITGTNSATWSDIDVSIDGETTQAFGTYYFNGSYFSHNTATREVVKKFSEVLRLPEWRENSIRVLVNISDYINDDLNDSNSLSELLTRLLNENINFAAWGNSTNQEQFKNLIKANNDDGIFIDNANYNNSIDQTATYIKKLVDEIAPHEEYVILGDPISVQVDPPDAMNNTADSNYPYGKWKITHDFEHYENNIGQFAESGKYIENFINTFDKTGRYQISYEDKAVVPENIYVHRRPTAQIILQRTGNNITLTSDSYDLDSYNEGNSGIQEEEWKYKKATDTEWTDGKLTTITGEDDYIVQLRVKDFQDTWSYPDSKYITNSVNAPPVASFSLKNETITRYDNLEIVDSSYDPAGGTITDYLWEVYKGDTKIYSGTTPPTNYKSQGVGSYSIYLTVTNAKGKTSERFGRVFTVIEDTIAPEVVVTPVESDWGESVTVNLVFSDKGGSEFKQYQYAITDSQDAPTTWSSAVTKQTDSIVINQEGLKYLHIKATDNAGNTSEDRIVGPYRIDKTNPVINYTGDLTTVMVDHVDIKLEARDEWSGIKSFTLNGHEISNGTYQFAENGTYKLIATDNVNHTTTINLVIRNVYYECTAGLEHPIYSSSCPKCPVCASYEGLEVTEDSHVYNAQNKQVKYNNPQNAKIVEYYNGSTTKPVLAGDYEYELKVIYEGDEATTGVKKGEYKTGIKGTYHVTPKEITITDIVAQSKIYNGNTSVVLSGGRLVGVCNGDEVRFSMPYSCETESKNVGTWKVAIGEITLEGAQAPNYTLTQPEYGTVTANITQRLLTVVNIEGKNKIYDGNKTVEIIKGEIVGLIENDDVTIHIPEQGESESEKAGTWPVTIEPITLEGEDVSNYRFVQPGKGDIQVIISTELGELIIGCDSKLYDREKVKPYVVKNNSTSEVKYTFYKSGTEEVVEEPFDVGIYDVIGYMATDGNYTEDTSNKVTFEIKAPEDPLLSIKSQILYVSGQEQEDLDKQEKSEMQEQNTEKQENNKEEHSQNKVEVSYKDKIIAEIEINNLGKGSGYAQKVIAKIPEGIELDKESSLNEENGWKEVESGVIETTKLSYESDINNEIFPEKEKQEITEKVKEEVKEEIQENTSKETIKQTLKLALVVSDFSKQAKDFEVQTEISQQNKRGDIISYTKENEQYSKTTTDMQLSFVDFSVEKEITKIIEKDTSTGAKREYAINQKTKQIIKVDLADKKIGHTELTVIYQITITNQGNKIGKIEEITDILPKGVTFEVAENPGWKIDDNGNAVYDGLKEDIASKDIKQLTLKVKWKADANNLAARTNYAMIDAKEDLDQILIKENKLDIAGSNNYDDSEMILSVNTGKIVMLWVALGVISLGLFITGVILIKRYVVIK